MLDFNLCLNTVCLAFVRYVNFACQHTIYSYVCKRIHVTCNCFSGDNVEEVFLETAKKIYQNIQDGKYVNIESK